MISELKSEPSSVHFGKLSSKFCFHPNRHEIRTVCPDGKYLKHVSYHFSSFFLEEPVS